MRTTLIFLLCLLTVQAAVFKKQKRANHYAVREANSDSGGYQYPPQAQSMGSSDSGGMSLDQHNAYMTAEFQSSSGASSGGSGGGGGSSVDNSAGGGGGGYHYEAPSTSSISSSSSLSGAPAEIQGLAGALESHVESSISNSGGGGNVFSSTNSFTPGSDGGGGGGGGGGHFDFNSVLQSTSGDGIGGGLGTYSGSSGSSDQFTALQGEVIDEKAPSIFSYKPNFGGGKDINNLPHILPPGGKSIQELQDEADAKLRAIVAKAKMNQIEVMERIQKLRTNYGFGTIGYDGWKDTRFKKMGEIDLGSHQAIDLGTSIDYNALKAPNGKLKLPVQNVYHTKTLGIHIPEPYPVKHEVAVPAPFPVPHPVPYPQHTPTPFSPIDGEDVFHLTPDAEKDNHFNPVYEPHAGPGNSYLPPSFSGGGKGSPFGASFNGFSGSFSGFNFGDAAPGREEGTGTSVTIEPSQAISESSSVGGPEYGAGTPNAASGQHSNIDEPHFHVDENSNGQLTVSMFGLPRGASSGNLGSYENQSSGVAAAPTHEYGVPSGEANVEGRSIQSEAGAVNIPSMNFSTRKQSPLQLLQRFHAGEGKSKRYLMPNRYYRGAHY